MDEQLLPEIRSAKNAVADAECELHRILGELERAERADKTTISQPLEKAFDELRAARGQLVRLQKLARAELP